MSRRILLGVGVGVAAWLVGLPVVGSIVLGLVVYAGSVFVAAPRAPARAGVDPFTLSEPWRQLIQQAQGSSRKLRRTVDGVGDGPLKQQLVAIADQLDRGLHEAGEIARRGDDIDAMVRNLEPTRLRSRLDTLRSESDQPSPDTAAAIASVEQQLATAERLARLSDETADSLRATQIRLDELVARASEVRIGMADSDTYAREVDDLVIRLEALHQALEETKPG